MFDDIQLHPLAYTIGGVGILVEWRAYFLSGELSFRRWSAAGALLWACQYFLLNAWTAGLTMGCTALRTILSGVLVFGNYKHWVVAAFVALFVVLTGISWQGPISFLPAFAVINTTFALFYFDNRPMRIGLLLSSIAWMANDFYWHAWPSFLAESVAMLINLHTIRKLFGTMATVR